MYIYTRDTITHQRDECLHLPRPTLCSLPHAAATLSSHYHHWYLYIPIYSVLPSKLGTL